MVSGHFNPLYAILTIVGAVSLHASGNILSDYFDFRSGIDLATTPTPFSGGSTILPSKLMSSRDGLDADFLALLADDASATVSQNLAVYFGSKAILQFDPHSSVQP